MTMNPSIVWLRQDLRIEDNPALQEAIGSGGPVIPVYNWAPEEEGGWPPGAASRWWLHNSLKRLQKELENIGLSLVIRSGSTLANLEQIIDKTGATAVFWNRRYEPASIQRDAMVKAELTRLGILAKSFNGNLLFEPWTILNKQNAPFKVFTPFWKACLARGEPSEPLPHPMKVAKKQLAVETLMLDQLELLPKIHWDKGLYEEWTPGTINAKKMLERFLKKGVDSYSELRDHPDEQGTSKMSPYLHFGEITSRMIWHAVMKSKTHTASSEIYLKQLGWREFAHHLLYHFPLTTSKPLRPDFNEFPWNDNKDWVKAWHKGYTGYPIVDAGMRQLWTTGWMHNRVRMIVGSFLVKDLLISWQEGVRWFWDTLVDADLANNTMGWQWVSGCGADAAPYFRVFNPVIQGEKFDLSGDYVRKWIPEIADLPNKWLHCPWEAPQDVLSKAGIVIGKTYPPPIVDHAEARLKALNAFHALKNR